MYDKASWGKNLYMAFFVVLSIVLAIAVLAPRYGVDSRDLARRGEHRQFPLLRDEGRRFA